MSRHLLLPQHRLLALFSACVLVILSAGSAAQSVESAVTATESVQSDTVEQTARLNRLEYIQNVLTQKLEERSQLGERIESANEQDKDDLRRQADELSNDITQLRLTFENIAIGGVDTSLFVPQLEEEEGNWREDVALIAQPVIDSLKDLTEKPRKLKALNDAIALHEQERDTASLALDNLAPAMALEPEGNLEKSLQRLVKVWEGRRNDANSAIEIARFQIADLQGDKSITETIIEALIDFVTGRGLTIVLAVLAASIVWFGVRFLLRGYRATLANQTTPESRTRYRLAAYSVHALTFVLILIAVFVVFYERGDVLLLGLLILLIVGLALGVRTLLPRYVSEARLLLNIGAMREAERVVYRDLPWRVESINMYTVLRNPELHGVLRIPLAEFQGVTSRPCGDDRWFPTSRGDIVLLDDERLLEVIQQNPDTVELRERGGQMWTVPTTEFYNTNMTNLTRGGTFGVISTFRIDYEHQSICTTTVPRILREAVRESLKHTDLADFVKDALVELKEASPSSIDYWLFVTMDSRAAKSYLRIQRAIQAACVQASTTQAWAIPYPHVSLVHKKTLE